MVDKEEKEGKREAEEVKGILSAVSTQVPGLIKSILASVFSEEAGRNMGKAAAAYYKELKNGGLPDQVAVKLTEDYMRTFTSLGDMMKSIGTRKEHGRNGEDIGEEIEKRLKQKLGKGKREHEQKDEEDED